MTLHTRRPPLARRIADLGPWFQNLRLDGIETAPDHPLGDYPAFKFAGFAHAIPERLDGWSVLDIGCNAGFYSFEMLRRGAGRVVGIDSDPRYLAQARLAAEVLGHDREVEFLGRSVYEAGGLGRFDLVIFMGVLYHLRHPLLALDILRARSVGRLLLFQTMQRGAGGEEALAEDYGFDDPVPFDSPGFPALRFVERRFAGDPTNWFVPNPAGTPALLRSAGFRIEAQPEPEVYLCAPEGAEAPHPPPQVG